MTKRSRSKANQYKECSQEAHRLVQKLLEKFPPGMVEFCLEGEVMMVRRAEEKKLLAERLQLVRQNGGGVAPSGCESSLKYTGPIQ